MTAIAWERFQEMGEQLLRQKWQFAKTMPKTPHWYTLRNTWEDEAFFERVVQFIRDYGYQEQYYRRTYTYLDINDMKYWTMGAPLSETILINRAYINRQESYDPIASVYDDLFQDADSIQENQDICQALPLTGRILDIGCGTGLLLDYCTIQPEDYMGLDPSQRMLAKLTKKHTDGYLGFLNAVEAAMWEQVQANEDYVRFCQARDRAYEEERS